MEISYNFNKTLESLLQLYNYTSKGIKIEGNDKISVLKISEMLCIIKTYIFYIIYKYMMMFNTLIILLTVEKFQFVR